VRASLESVLESPAPPPGTYDAASGEVFPLLPFNVAIIGDEANSVLPDGGPSTARASACRAPASSCATTR
jgi:hypothetical protein